MAERLVARENAMPARRDYKVDPRSRSYIAAKASSVRRVSGKRLDANFDVVDLLRDYTLYFDLKIKFNLVDRVARGDPPASVEFNPISLRIKRDIWRNAQDFRSPSYER